jgi:catechol 2,3-dioxygenase-like lactoylglutathione lyase family enzyme
MAEFPPITHVAVTVTDLDRSTRWYSELLASEPVLDEDEQAGGFHHTVFALGGGQLLGLHTHPQAGLPQMVGRRSRKSGP